MGPLCAGYVTHMAQASPTRATSSAFIGAGLLIAAIVVVVAFIVDSDFGWPVLILAVICLAAALAYRAITSSGRASDVDSTDNIPRQEPRGERPLGDTPEAHDEINPHDLPRDHPGREEAEDMAGGSEGTTRGPLPGG